MNIRDIARLANVTPGTVSKVLNNYPDISEATRQHVLQIIKENQYTTKNGGRKFKQAVTPRIGLVSENVYNWVSETMQNLLSVRFHNADYTVLSFQGRHEAALLNHILDKVGEGLGLIGLALGDIGDDAGVEVNRYLVPV